MWFLIAHHEFQDLVILRKDPTVLSPLISIIIDGPSAFRSPNSMDLGLTMDLDQSSSEGPFVAEWELWGEEQMISLCEVRIEARKNVPRKSP